METHYNEFVIMSIQKSYAIEIANLMSLDPFGGGSNSEILGGYHLIVIETDKTLKI